MSRDYQEDIDDILDNFDFERVKKAMDALEWKYFDSAEKTINTYELRKTARYLLKSLIPHASKDYYMVGTGGFQATVVNCGDPVFKLQFVVEEWTNEH